jgi:hypothetical protein
MIWRWDQGRLLYFEFNTLRNISKVLLSLNGLDLKLGGDLLRKSLQNMTGMPFAPSNYTVWRNYKRVFECSFLATRVNNQMITTDFCQELSSNIGKIIDVDDYFSFFFPRFRFPFPAFQEYDPSDNVVFPFCAILKYLVSKKITSAPSMITLDEVFNRIIANDCNGSEDIDFYNSLLPRSINISEDQRRQVREMLIFSSQMSILKWFNNSLYLDISLDDIDTFEFRNLITPIIITPKISREEDFLTMTSLGNEIIIPTKLRSRESDSDELFIEGKRTRVTHLKIERSPILRSIFLQNNSEPICNMCEVNMRLKYPWTKYLLEIHHILPLSHAISISAKGTSLFDLIGLCPTCHRSVHLYYKGWLDDKKQDDFINKEEAKEIYLLAKEKMVL